MMLFLQLTNIDKNPFQKADTALTFLLHMTAGSVNFAAKELSYGCPFCI
jgi:hypothetical protein